MYALTIVRHGQSTYNKEKRFSGWSNAPLTHKGRVEAVFAGKVLKKSGHNFDVCFTSCLSRAHNTAHLILNEMGVTQDILQQDWHLNERHYGALQDRLREDMSVKHGASKVSKWRTTYEEQPPKLSDDDPRWLDQLERFSAIQQDLQPRGESMQQAVQRTQRFWKSDIIPALKDKKKVLVVAHTNTLRSFVRDIENLTDVESACFRISTASPRHYELDESCNPLSSYDLEKHVGLKIRQWVHQHKYKP